MRKREKDIEGQEPFAPAQPATSGASKPISPLEIQQKEFRYARFGGYKMRDVDEFLDRVTESMSAVVTENERLRAGGASPSPVLGTPDLDDVGRQADEIIQRARDEAAKIVADARARSAATGVATGAGVVTLEERAAINAFLTREKEFLQSLAGLVQDHAGSVKEMAKDARTRGTAPAAPPAAKPAAPPAAKPAAAQPAPKPTRSPEKAVEAAPTSTSATPAPASAPAPADAPAPVRTSSSAPGDTTISLPRAEEPAAAGVRRDGGDDDARDSGDSSLRELFWGEE